MLKHKNKGRVMMRKVKTLFGRFFKSNQGVTVLEFGLVAPLFLVLLMGIFEISITRHTRIHQEAMRLLLHEHNLQPQIVRPVKRV